LSAEIYQAFAGKTKVTKRDVDKFVIVGTIYPTGKLVTAALRKLEGEGLIADIRKIEAGAKRKAGTYSEVYITF